MNYCTLFNSYYLSRGLALYHSLENCAKKFHLFIFAFDDPAYEILTKLNLQHATIISLSSFETPELLLVKPLRTIAEYCWTCTSSVILHCLEKYQLSEVCYLDADLYFWRDPADLLIEAKNASILITEHRYTKEYDHAAVSGKYCVQFMYFKNNPRGLKALTWWKEACLAWCYNRVEDGKFGDQKYLDDWLERFEDVCVLQHLGGGVAPWNVQQYKVKNAQGLPILAEIATGKTFDLYFYHFHALKFINQRVDYGTYKLSSSIQTTLYRPYVQALLEEEIKLKNNINLTESIKLINMHGVSMVKNSIIHRLKNFKKRWLGTYNIKRLNNF